MDSSGLEYCNSTAWVTIGQAVYRDADSDNYGDPNVRLYVFDTPDGYVPNNADCNDTDLNISPGMTEIIGNNIDDNCDGIIQMARFTDMGDGTVRDESTGFIWLKDAMILGGNFDYANSLAAALNSGEHGLTDGSSEGDWRLPTWAEWEAFVDTNYANPALSNASGDAEWSPGDAFINVLGHNNDYYWSSERAPSWCYSMRINTGQVSGGLACSNDLGAWPVRNAN